MGFFDLSAYTIERGDEKKRAPIIHDCRACGRSRGCNTPKVSYTGEGLKRILVVGPEVTSLEDKTNNESHGTHYKYLKKQFKKVGIDLESDCWYTHSVRCHGKKEYGSITESACHALLVEEVRKLKPLVIVTTCQEAFDILLYERMAGRASTAKYFDWCGERIPDQVLGCWIAPIYPTSLMLQAEEDTYNKYEFYYNVYLQRIAEIKKDSPIYQTENAIKICTNYPEAHDALKEIATWPKFAFDYETTGIKPHRNGHEIVAISASNGKISYSFGVSAPILKLWASIMQNDAVKIAHNQSFERSWTEVIVGVEPKNLIHDTMLAQHCLNNRKPTGLKFLTYAHYGFLGYDTELDEFLKGSKEEQEKYGANAFNEIVKAPQRKLLTYNAMDSLFTYWLYEDIIDALDADHQLPGYKFFMQAQPALDRASQNGILIDVKNMASIKKTLTHNIEAAEKLIMDDELIHMKWDSGAFNPRSDKDVRHLLFDILKYKVYSFTETGLPAVDAESLAEYRDKCPLADNLLKYRRWGKIRDTYIAQDERETVSGIVRASFNLGRVVTFRSSISNPSKQNIPKRDKEVKDIIRSIYIPSPGCKLLEYDFKGAEVSASAAISGDRNLIKYVSDPSLDMHRDLATGLFFLDISEVNKTIRGELVKGPWTFAQFYGSWHKQCADNIWQMLQVPSAEKHYGIDILGRLAENGVETQEDWVEHCKKQEAVLWGEEFFEGYQKFRDDTFAFFKKNGYIDYVNGFRYHGPASRNECLNAPIQGPAFHIQLWAFKEIARILKEKGMKTRIVNQVHDSQIYDCPPEEETYLDYLVYEYATQKVREFYPWVTVPLLIEKESSEVNGSWAKMKAEGYLKGGVD